MTIDVTLENCEDEPIRTPGAIQPHGLLFLLSGENFSVDVVSDNVGQLLGISPQQWLGRPLSEHLAQRNLSVLERHQQRIDDGDLEAAFEMVMNIDGEARLFDARLCRQSEQQMLLELDNSRKQEDHSPYTVIDILAVQAILSRLGRQSCVATLADAVVREVKSVTGFDRVMVYRFHPDFHGEVIAESVVDNWEPYMGLHFPESDIPRQARALYCENPIRSIASSTYEPVPLCLAHATQEASGIDLSHSQLRSVSPIHLEYLRNMGVGSSMSISLMDGDQLWGLIACHHKTSLYFDYRSRKACELLGTTFSLMLLQLEESEHSRELVRLQDIERQLIAFMSDTVPFIDGAFRYLPNLSDMTNADGAVSISDGVISGVGLMPSEEHIEQFVDWLAERERFEVYSSHSVTEDFPDARHWANDLRGVLVIEISRERRQFLLCFRRQAVHSVKWAGNPAKNISNAGKDQRLKPRESFTAWVQDVSDKSEEWSSMEISVAHTLRRTILHVIVGWTKEVAGLNQKLNQSNLNLQTFAETAAHDLKEPLRGIDTYISFIREDHGSELSEEMQRKFSVINSLAKQGHDLTDAILSFSEVGENLTSRVVTGVDRALDAALRSVEHMLNKSSVEIRRPSALPQAWIDETLITQLFQNLLTNAIKYSQAQDPWVEIGHLDELPEDAEEAAENSFKPGDTILYVKDNGIGISQDHIGEIFKLFKRVHPRTEYGGGSGIGLSIAQRIVDCHDGHLWVSSTLGEGSTFYFTLKAA